MAGLREVPLNHLVLATEVVTRHQSANHLSKVPDRTLNARLLALGCSPAKRTADLKRARRASSGRTPTVSANGTAVRREPRFCIRKLKYDGSLVGICLSIPGCMHGPP